MKKKKVFLSVAKKTAKFNNLVLAFLAGNYELIASGGTFLHVRDHLNLPVTHASEITHLKPIEGKENVLDHRVETLCPQIHGALLADEVRHMEELEKLGWPFIDAVVCTFYDLPTAMAENYGNFAVINEKVDIGGPTMGRSAIKGGRIMLVDENDFSWATIQLTREDGIFRQAAIKWLHAKAIAWITQYLASEGIFRVDQIRPE